MCILSSHMDSMRCVLVRWTLHKTSWTLRGLVYVDSLRCVLKTWTYTVFSVPTPTTTTSKNIVTRPALPCCACGETATALDAWDRKAGRRRTGWGPWRRDDPARKGEGRTPGCRMHGLGATSWLPVRAFGPGDPTARDPPVPTSAEEFVCSKMRILTPTSKSGATGSAEPGDRHGPDWKTMFRNTTRKNQADQAQS